MDIQSCPICFSLTGGEPMLNKKIEYYTKVPVNAYVSCIRKQPVHSHHDDIEIVVALKGTVKIIVGYRTLLLKKGEVFIFNDRDIHCIYETEGENLVLTIHINIKYFRKYNEADFDSFFLMAATSLNDARYDKPIEELKEQLFGIAKMQMKKSGSDESLEAQGKELLQKLLDDFQYFYYTTSGGRHFVNRYDGKNNQAQAARVRALMYYLWDNYGQKITLQEYADETHINMYYLSHIIKNSTGLNFQELLNFTRVEESEPLLLESNKKISEIAFECGFSATRYYVKYFEKWFQMSPKEYREKHMHRLVDKFDEEILDVEESLNAIEEFWGQKRYLNSRETYYYTDVIEIDADKKSRKRKFQYQQLIEWDHNLQSEYGSESDAVRGIKPNFKLCVRIEDVRDLNSRLLQFLQESKTHSLLFVYDTTRKTKEEYGRIFEALGSFCGSAGLPQLAVNIEYIGDISEKTKAKIAESIVKLGEDVKCRITVKKVTGCSMGRYTGNYILDSIYIVPWIIRSSLRSSQEQKFINMVFDKYRGSGSIISGDTGMITSNYIKKPSYYAYMGLSMLGDEILDNTDAYIVTRKNRDIIVLFYDYDDRIFSNIDDYADMNKLATLRFDVEKSKEYKLEFTNLQGRYAVTEVSLGRDICVFSKMMDMGMPEVLMPEEESCMREFIRPKLDFCIVDSRDGSASLEVKVPRYGMSILKLRAMIE